MYKLIPTLFLLAACAEPQADGETEATGKATYRDAETEPGGGPRTPERVSPQPASDPMRVEILVDGTATFQVTEPQCQLDQASGAFDGLYEGEATIDDDGVYLASFASADATFETPSDCTLPELSIGTLTGVVVRAELTTTQQNCDTYCAAKARSEAEAECEGDADEATCRAAAESSYEATCETACAPSTHRIVARTALGVSALADLNASALTGTGLGTLEVDLMFDRIEDEDGQVVPE